MNADRAIEHAARLEAVDRVRRERARQVLVEGYSAALDDEHCDDHQLALAAVSYLLPEERRHIVAGAPSTFPWPSDYWKPTPDDRERELEKALALGQAELERLIRARMRREAAERAQREGSQT